MENGKARLCELALRRHGKDGALVVGERRDGLHEGLSHALLPPGDQAADARLGLVRCHIDCLLATAVAPGEHLREDAQHLGRVGHARAEQLGVAGLHHVAQLVVHQLCLQLVVAQREHGQPLREQRADVHRLRVVGADLEDARQRVVGHVAVLLLPSVLRARQRHEQTQGGCRVRLECGAAVLGDLCQTIHCCQPQHLILILHTLHEHGEGVRHQLLGVGAAELNGVIQHAHGSPADAGRLLGVQHGCKDGCSGGEEGGQEGRAVHLEQITVGVDDVRQQIVLDLHRALHQLSSLLPRERDGDLLGGRVHCIVASLERLEKLVDQKLGQPRHVIRRDRPQLSQRLAAPVQAARLVQRLEDSGQGLDLRASCPRALLVHQLVAHHVQNLGHQGRDGGSVPSHTGAINHALEEAG
mmetsp:Transcript_13929/g.44653  ORF Transcript_13929/g.44653 Transcript_13929/m.44653 type:complete len:413 (+) Transcript_13929:291-1529(+)